MKLRIKTDAARAIRAGLNMPEVAVVEFDPADATTQVREFLAGLVTEGVATLPPSVKTPMQPEEKVAGRGFNSWSDIPLFQDLTPATVLTTLDAWLTGIRAEFLSKQAREQETFQAYRGAVLTCPIEKFLGGVPQYDRRGDVTIPFWPADGVGCPSDSVRSSLANDPEVAKRIEEAKSLAQSRWQAWRAEVDARRAIEAAEQAEKDAIAARLQSARRLLLRSYVDLQGSPSQRARVAAGAAPLGRLPEQEAENCLRDYLFAGISTPQHGKIRANDVRAECPDWDGCSDGKKVEFFSEDPVELTEEEFVALQSGEQAVLAIRELDVVKGHAGEVTVAADIREHIGRWDCGDQEHEWHMIVRPALRIAVEFSTADGPCATFSREFTA